MKVAIIHDWLNHKVGGAENVVFKLAEMYPEADIFTLVYNKNKFDKFLGGRNIVTSGLQKFPSFIKKRPKLFLPFIKRSVERMDLNGYDLIISSSTAWVKNINTPKNSLHICYCHSPARMLWDSWPKYFYEQKPGVLTKLYIIKLASKLRLWDYYKSQKDIKFIANSEFVQARISKFYKKNSKIIYPPVNIEGLEGANEDKKDFYLILSVLAKYKNIELAIRAFIASGKNLVIAGDGPDMQRLKEISGNAKNISFLGRVEEKKKNELMASAKGFIFCNIEDFGITIVESIASGTGVIALEGGGASEIIIDKQTGVFYKQPNEENLNRAIVEYERTILKNRKFNNKYVFEKFSEDKFEKDFRSFVNEKQ